MKEPGGGRERDPLKLAHRKTLAEREQARWRTLGTTEPSVIVSPPVRGEGRQVWVGEVLLGTVHSLSGLTHLLQCEGWEGFDEVDVAEMSVIEWYGGGPEVWSRRD